MTRINAGVPPRKLHRLHLIAEYRELPMVPAALRRALRTATRTEVVARIPENFTLGVGHVRFFYDKLRYIVNRYGEIKLEMIRRGYVPKEERRANFSEIDACFFRDWRPTREAARLVRERIALRMAEKPRMYRGG